MISVTVAFVMSLTVGAVALLVQALRRRCGDRQIDTAGGVLIVVFFVYFAAMICYAAYLAFGNPVPLLEIKDESLGFVR